MSIKIGSVRADLSGKMLEIAITVAVVPASVGLACGLEMLLLKALFRALE